MKPITPNEVLSHKEKIIPEFVIEAFNNCISRNFTNNSSIIKQKEIIEEIKKLSKITSTDTIFESKWLDVEDIYRKQGWIVTYDKPAYNESYDPSFEFTVKYPKIY